MKYSGNTKYNINRGKNFFEYVKNIDFPENILIQINSNRHTEHRIQNTEYIQIYPNGIFPNSRRTRQIGMGPVGKFALFCRSHLMPSKGHFMLYYKCITEMLVMTAVFFFSIFQRYSWEVHCGGFPIGCGSGQARENRSFGPLRLCHFFTTPGETFHKTYIVCHLIWGVWTLVY